MIDGSRLKSDGGLMTGVQTNPGIRSGLFYGALQLDHVNIRISKGLFKLLQENKPAFKREVKGKMTPCCVLMFFSLSENLSMARSIAQAFYQKDTLLLSVGVLHQQIYFKK